MFEVKALPSAIRAVDMQRSDKSRSGGEVQPVFNLCLSGGGYRAMLFHAGVLQGLNDRRILGKLAGVSSVSGGSITASVLATRWSDLAFEDGQTESLQEYVTWPLQELADKTIDRPAILRGFFSATASARYIARRLDKMLLDERTLASLPAAGQGAPQFFFHATDLQYGTVFLFSRDLVGGIATALYRGHDAKVSTAVAASAAFPPFLAPVVLDLTDLHDSPRVRIVGDSADPETSRTLLKVEKTKDNLGLTAPGTVLLVDGGVSGNLALKSCFAPPTIENVPKVIVSDGGRPVTKLPKPPKANWFSTIWRTMDTIMDRAERADARDSRLGDDTLDDPISAYNTVGEGPILVRISQDPLRDWVTTRRLLDRVSPLSKSERQRESEILRVLSRPQLLRRAIELVDVDTRLKRLDRCQQEHLINVGYISAIAAYENRVNAPVVRSARDGTLGKQDYHIAITAPHLPYPWHPELLRTMSAKEKQFLLHRAMTDDRKSACTTSERASRRLAAME